MIEPGVPRSQSTPQKLAKEVALVEYTSVIEHIKSTHYLAVDFIYAVENRYQERREWNGEENHDSLYEEHVFYFEDFGTREYPTFQLHLYPELVEGKTSLSSHQVKEFIAGEDTLKLVLQLPKVLEEEKKTVLEMMEVFIDYLHKASTLHSIQDCIAVNTGLLERRDFSEPLSEHRAVKVLSTSDIIQIEMLQGEVNRLKGQFLFRRDRFNAGTASQQQPQADLSEANLPASDLQV